MRARRDEASYRSAEPDAWVARAWVAALRFAGFVWSASEPRCKTGVACYPFSEARVACRTIAEAYPASAGGPSCGGGLERYGDHTRTAFWYAAACGVCSH